LDGRTSKPGTWRYWKFGDGVPSAPRQDYRGVTKGEADEADGVMTADF
jgi:hypothetical protein